MGKMTKYWIIGTSRGTWLLLKEDWCLWIQCFETHDVFQANDLHRESDKFQQRIWVDPKVGMMYVVEIHEIQKRFDHDRSNRTRDLRGL